MLDDPWVLALVFVLVYYGAGAQESRMGGKHNGLLWACLSIALSALVVLLFKGGWGWLLGCQLGLFLAIGVFRASRDR